MVNQLGPEMRVKELERQVQELSQRINALSDRLNKFVSNGLKAAETGNLLPAPGGDNGESIQFARADHGHPVV
jgi:hypothetical protein